MPRYTCTTSQALSSETKAALAQAITATNTEVIGSPTRYVHVMVHELAPENFYTDSQPSDFLAVEASIRAGRPDETKSRLATEVSRACSESTGIPESRLLVSIKETPARFVSEGGHIMPEPGHEND